MGGYSDRITDNYLSDPLNLLQTTGHKTRKNQTQCVSLTEIPPCENHTDEAADIESKTTLFDLLTLFDDYVYFAPMEQRQQPWRFAGKP